MKLKAILGSVAVLTLGLGGVAYAGDYFAPERLTCKLDDAYKLTCNSFNRQYLTEDTYTADFPAGQEVVFHFASGVAYFTPDQTEWTILFTFKDANSKNVTLKTVNTTIQPDLRNGAWKKYKNEFYTCDAGYMSCLITNLPASK